jgi:hypothetical protein
MSLTVLSRHADIVEAWRRLSPRFQASPYHHPTYGQLATGPDGQFQVVLWEHAGVTVWHPVLVNPIPNSTWWDAESPYGLNGPLLAVNGIPAETADINPFWLAWQQHCHQHHIVAEFVRFNPLLQNHAPWSACFQTFSPKPTVCVSQGAYHTRLQRGLKQAQKNGLVSQINHWPAWPTFTQCYSQLMTEKNSATCYQFNAPYWQGLKQFIEAGHGFFLTVSQNHTCFGGVIFLTAGAHAYYHLGAISSAGKTLKGSPFALAQAIDYAQQNGATQVMLGGGLTADDSLQLFKQQFAPHQPLMPYIVGKTIHLPDHYQQLRQQHGLANPPDIVDNLFFYRDY